MGAIVSTHIFCGYAHEDGAFVKRLRAALAGLCRQDGVTVWHDREILPGAEWDTEIEQQLQEADIILLLISPDFMSSEYCVTREMRLALARHKSGDAHVVPVLLRPTSGWDATGLGALQALPTHAKPITLWGNRDAAFADVVDGLTKLLQKVQTEEKYPLSSYLLGLRFSIYEGDEHDGGGVLAQEQANRSAEQWLQESTVDIGGTLHPISEDEHQQEWVCRLHQQDCRIQMVRRYHGRDVFGLRFRSADIYLTSTHLALLDRMIEAGKFPYFFIQWTLTETFDVAALARRIYEKTGKYHLSASAVERLDKSLSIEYRLFHDGDDFATIGHSVRATCRSRGPSSPAGVCLIYDNLPFGGFYRAHTLFSPRKIFSALCADVPYNHTRQLVEDACKPEAHQESSRSLSGE